MEQCLRIGDFEGDTVRDPPGSGGLATLVDRKSRYTIIVKIRCKDADHVHQKIKERVQQLDEQENLFSTEQFRQARTLANRHN